MAKTEVASRAERYSTNDDEAFETDFRTYLEAIAGRGWTRNVSQALEGGKPNTARDVAWWMVNQGGTVVALHSSIDVVRSHLEKRSDRSLSTSDPDDTTTIDVYGIVDDQPTLIQVIHSSDDGESVLDADRIAGLETLDTDWLTELRVGAYRASESSMTWLNRQSTTESDEIDRWVSGDESTISVTDFNTSVHDLSDLPPCNGAVAGVGVLILYEHFVLNEASNPVASDHLKENVAAILDVDERVLTGFKELLQSSPLFAWTKLTNQYTVHLDVAGIAYGATLRRRMGENVPVATTLRALAESRPNLIRFFNRVSEAAVSSRRQGGILPSFTDDDPDRRL